MSLESENNESPSPSTPSLDQAQLSNLVNAAVTAHLKRQKPADNLEALVNAAIEKRFASPKEEPSETEQLRKQLETLNRKVSESERIAAEARFLDSLKNELLTSGKVKAKAVPVIADIFKARGMVDAKSQTLNIGSESLSIGEGVARFLDTEEASYFLDAPTSQATQVKQAPKNTFTPKATAPVSSAQSLDSLSPEEKYKALQSKMIGLDLV